MPALLLILAFAAALRWYRLDEQDFWQDELHSLYNSAGTRGEVEALPYGVILKDLPRYSDLRDDSTWLRVWHTMRDDSHPPLYFLLLLTWRKFFGDAEGIVRTLPVLFSVASLIPMWLILREFGRPIAGLCAAALAAVSFSHIHIAQENRPYSLSLLLVSVSFWLLVRIGTRWTSWSAGRRVLWLAAYAGAIFAAMLTHYFAGLALLGQVLYVLIRFRGLLLGSWLSGVSAASVIFAFLWGPVVLHQLDFIAAQDWLLEDQPDHVQRTVLRFADLPVRLLFACKRFQLDEWNSLTGAGILASSLLLLWRGRKKDSLVFVLWYFVPVVLLSILDLARGQQLLNHLRYGSLAIPGLCGLIVIACANLPSIAQLVPTMLIAITGQRTLTLPAQVNPHSRKVAVLLAHDLRETDLLIYDAAGWPRFWPLRMYQTVSYYLPTSPPTLLLRDASDGALQNQIATFDRIYVVSPRIDGIPNPTPETHPYVEASEHIFDIGWVYRLGRKPPSEKS